MKCTGRARSWSVGYIRFLVTHALSFISKILSVQYNKPLGRERVPLGALDFESLSFISTENYNKIVSYKIAHTDAQTNLVKYHTGNQ
jgi:hypothetical protein